MFHSLCFRFTDIGPYRVNQPLPLPQGVSDYAVGGNGMIQPLAIASQSPAVYRQEGIAQRDIVMKTKTGPDGMADSTDKRALAEKKSTISITIGDIAVSGGLSKETLRTVIEKHMDKFEKCYKAGSSKGTVAFVFAINTNGTIKTIKTISDTLKNETTTKCIMDEMKKHISPAVADGCETTATITFTMG
jgi:Ca-activated chloride channel family protein